MGKILNAYILPHPPILIPDVGKGEGLGAASTLNAVKRVAGEIKNLKPTTIIVTTPHGPVFQDFVHISVQPELSGSFERFGAAGVKLQFENNLGLTENIIKHGNAANIYCGGLDNKLASKYKVSRELDHGAGVPLYFISNEYKDFKLVHISIAFMPLIELYRFGACITKAVEESDENVVFIASGDLSHKLSDEGPYGFNISGPVFDRQLVDNIKTNRPEMLLEMDESLCENAGECGLRSFIIMMGALEKYEIKSEIYSYEGPFGVGYCVARVEPISVKSGVGTLDEIKKREKDKVDSIRNEEDVYVSLARRTLEAYVKGGKQPAADSTLPAEMLEHEAGVFVSLKKHGQLRGCIGTIFPVEKNVAEEIINNAISSGTRDPRFEPVQEHELESLVYSVDVLNKPEPIESRDELDVYRYGVIVRNGSRSGLLLPNLEGVDTVEKQVSIALQKAGISPDEKYKMERFEVIRHK